MPTKKKIDNNGNATISGTEPLLNEEEVWDVINFSRAMLTGMYQPMLTPELVSSRMRDITLNPLASTEEEITAALKDPKNSEDKIRGVSQGFEVQSMVYKRLLSYLSNMLSFDITYTSSAEPDDYKKPRYKSDLKVIENFVENFDYKNELRIAIKEMLRNDAYFACFRDLGDSYTLQELPSDYCKITGRWSGGFLFSFNMYWFLLPGVDINMYPDFFKQKYKDVWLNPNSNKQNYIPSLPPELRDKSTWVYWVDIPVDVGVCFKFNPELATRLPYFTPLFSDLVLQALMRNLQKNANMAAASRMIVGEVPMLNKDVKAAVRDAIAVSPDLLGKFLALVRSSISEAVKVASAPLTNMQGIQFDAENELYDSYLRTTLASTGINTNLTFTSDVKQNAIETQLSLNVDEQLMTALYGQCNSFMNYFANKYTKTFKFKFEFEGTDFFLNRKERLDKATALFNLGIILPQKIAASIGMKPSQFRKHMEEAKATDFMGMLTPPAVLNPIAVQTGLLKAGIAPQGATDENSSSGEGGDKNSQSAEPAEPEKKPAGRGRPRKTESEIGESGQNTRDIAGNVGRGGKEE